MDSSSSSASSPTSSKRLSLGPRPLHLVDANSPFFIPSNPSTKSIRRHSSISYRSSTADSPIRNKSFKSPSFELKQRPPLTLVEKHSDLLHYIAQKESKCLELRSQLASLESELLQLKRKWERIVNRGHLDSPLTSPSSPQGNNPVLEGIVEGVQGVGRFLVSGLAIGEVSQPSPPLSRPSPAPSTRPLSRPTSPLSLSSSPFFAEANSSTSPVVSSPIQAEPSQLLMVHDTGATPTMSPNPVFELQLELQQQRRPQSDEQSTALSPVAPHLSTLTNSSMLHRRKSRDPHTRSRMLEEAGTSSSPVSDVEIQKVDIHTVRSKRAGPNSPSLPPVSSIPGLAALTVGPGSPVPGWVESVGKKWDELQRGSTFVLSAYNCPVSN
ncbi:hypothetical protein H0H93_009004 [Arthromyces matolae]|nr:hypothetical protein H0H93_009004 [Arthromyces matolae]